MYINDTDFVLFKDLVKFDRCVRCKKDLQCLHLEDRAASISLAYGANRLCELLTRHNLLLHRLEKEFFVGTTCIINNRSYFYCELL